jgi:hypothetical protein
MVMRWWDYHLYTFEQAGTRYADFARFGNDDPKAKNGDKYSLSKLLKKPGDSITYTYDLGDCWQHVIVLEQLIKTDPETDRPVAECLYGKRARPPEDCGGVLGFIELLIAVEDPEHRTTTN